MTGEEIDTGIRGLGCWALTNLEGSRLYIYGPCAQRVLNFLNAGDGRRTALRNFLISQARVGTIAKRS